MKQLHNGHSSIDRMKSLARTVRKISRFQSQYFIVNRLYHNAVVNLAIVSGTMIFLTVRMHIYWSNVNKQIEHFGKTCEKCALAKVIDLVATQNKEVRAHANQIKHRYTDTGTASTDSSFKQFSELFDDDSIDEQLIQSDLPELSPKSSQLDEQSSWQRAKFWNLSHSRLTLNILNMFH